ncbi:MAG: CoA transferase [Actinomycetota bacterium]|nr:CoA transferase [Actinomycetota bacterium]MDQ3735470.1 CoA transferase [Actinomycetota bacterium]
MGPLQGVRVVEMAGRGPGPFTGMLLADLGAEVIRIDRPNATAREQAPDDRLELVGRGRRSMVVDLKHPEGRATVLRLVEQADAMFEGFRPGVMERLGLGPDECMRGNPRLVYGRATGWGQEGPLSLTAGHDINYIALAGALEPIGRYGAPPTVPLNLVGDYAGGGMMLALGLVCALLEARSSGVGQVVDSAMVDGASLLMTVFHGRRLAGTWLDERGTNYVDSGAPFYDVYETADRKYIAVGAIEPKFHREMLRRIGFDLASLPDVVRRKDWPELKAQLADIFKSKTRAEWTALLEGTDSCFAPVLGLGEVDQHPHHQARQSFVEVAGVSQPAPAPRFSRTAGEVCLPPPLTGEHTDEILKDWGFSDEEARDLRACGALR